MHSFCLYLLVLAGENHFNALQHPYIYFTVLLLTLQFEAVRSTLYVLNMVNEERSESMPFLTLEPCGKERLVINLHFPVLWPLGMSLDWFRCSLGCREGGIVPSMCLLANSSAMYLETPSECSLADSMFNGGDLNGASCW